MMAGSGEHKITVDTEEETPFYSFSGDLARSSKGRSLLHVAKGCTPLLPYLYKSIQVLENVADEVILGHNVIQQCHANLEMGALFIRAKEVSLAKLKRGFCLNVFLSSCNWLRPLFLEVIVYTEPELRTDSVLTGRH